MPTLIKHIFTVRVLVVCICISAVLSFYLGLVPFSTCEKQETGVHKNNVREVMITAAPAHRLAVIVPHRDRFEELLEFIPHVSKFLHNQGVHFKIYVINQADNLRFNRASLVNIGYLISQKECDYIAMHDVDLLPLNPKLNYSYPEAGPYHVAAPQLHPLYHYPTFVGGILLMRGDHFRKVNGLSNKYWGWGKEDDEFYVRMKQADLQIFRPGDIGSGPADTFKHVHDRVKRKRDRIRYLDQKKISRQRDYVTGIDTLKYEEISRYKLTVEDAVATVVNVKLECDMAETPWCIHLNTKQ